MMKMAAGEKKSSPDLRRIFQNILLLALAVFLPAFDFTVFGWLNGAIPLIAFIVVYRFGRNVGKKIILAGGFLALAAGLIAARYEYMLVSLSLIPCGYAVASSSFRHESPALAGLKGIAVLGGCLVLLLGALATIHEIRPYAVFLESLDQGIAGALEYYRQNESITPDMLVVLESSLYQIKTVLPLIMPSLLTGLVMLPVWIALVAGNRVIYQLSGSSPWPQYRFWQIPDKIVWLMIVSALAALLPASIFRVTGSNALIIFGIIYFFQGLSVFSFFLHKWNLPLVLRTFLYVMVVFQSFGAILLLGTGLADVWLDFRKIRKSTDTVSADT